jgi:hypothetical protein
MAISTQMTPAQVATNIQQRLLALRAALEGVEDLYGWTSGLTAADLAAASGYSEDDAPAVLSAVADANALAQIANTGLPPSTYPQPSTAYVYAASQRQVIGPQ